MRKRLLEGLGESAVSQANTEAPLVADGINQDGVGFWCLLHHLLSFPLNFSHDAKKGRQSQVGVGHELAYVLLLDVYLHFFDGMLFGP